MEMGEMYVTPIIQWIQENGIKYISSELQLEDCKSSGEVDLKFLRMWVYSHHIFAKSKRRDILDWTQELELTGFSLPGKPGLVCVEGPRGKVEEFWQRLRSLNWKKLVLKDQEEYDIGPGGVTELQKFDDFAEQCFEPREGKGREYHMDLGMFADFLEKHNCRDAFNLFFNV